MEINDGYIPKQKPSIQQIIEQEAKTLMLGNSTLKQAFISGANFALGLDRWVKVEEGCEFPEVNSWV